MNKPKDVLRIQMQVSKFAYPEIFEILVGVRPYYKSKRLMQLALDGLNARRGLIAPALTPAPTHREETVAVNEPTYSEPHYKISESSATAICNMLDKI